jgi:hypothetical protein
MLVNVVDDVSIERELEEGIKKTGYYRSSEGYKRLDRGGLSTFDFIGSIISTVEIEIW